jgi:hypothetical protein
MRITNGETERQHRLMRHRAQPDPVVEHEATIQVIVSVVVPGRLLFDRVEIAEPRRVHQRLFQLHHRVALPDLSDWPGARGRVDAEAEQLTGEVSQLMASRGLQLAPGAGQIMTNGGSHQEGSP